MSFSKSITSQFLLKLNSKNIVIVKGNTTDFVFPKISKIQFKNGDLDVNSQTDMLSLPEFFSRLLYDNDYKQITYYSPSLGVIEAQEGILKVSSNAFKYKSEEEDVDNDKENSDSFPFKNDFDNDGFSPNLSKEASFSSLVNSIEEEFKNTDSDEIKSHAFIIDLSEFIFSDKNQELKLSEIQRLISTFSDYINKRYSDYLNDKFKLILIQKNDLIFSSVYFNKANETAILTIKKPEADERKEFIQTFTSSFNKYNKDLFKEQVDIDKAVAITHDLSYREILQMLKIIKFNKNVIEIKNFKQLYRLYQFEQKESSWEKLGYEDIKNCEQFFKSKVQGQDEPIKAIKNTLIRSFVGLQGISQSSLEDNNKPRGILFLAGPTGTGKTEIVKALSELVFGDQKRIIRFDMSEYNHEESDQKLIGSAPGYVGYEAGGQLTNAVLEQPFSILLFDEIEKANGKILDKFLQILEDGRLTSSKGELVDFSETFIVFTSNIGANNCDFSQANEKIRNHFKHEVIKYFNNSLGRPELLNRIGIKNIVPFNPIKDVEIASDILKKKLERILLNIKQKHLLKIKPSNDKSLDLLLDYIYKKYDNSLGGRGLVANLETYFVDYLSQWMFNNYEQLTANPKEYKEVTYTVDNNGIKFELLKD